MNTFTKENTLDATHVMHYNSGNVEFHNDVNQSFLANSGLWVHANLGVKRKLRGHITLTELSYPPGERKEDHTIDGVVTYALRYKLDLLTEEATHCYKECPTFYRLTLGKYAAVLKNNSVWVTSDCTTNEELNGPEFFALDADQDKQIIEPWVADHLKGVGAIAPKPVFTQAMHKDGIMPPIGSKITYHTSPRDEDGVAAAVIGHHNEWMWILTDSGRFDQITMDVGFSFPDNRTDDDKLLEALIWEAGEFNGPRIFNSDKFTISLKE